jgi:hypothetical protein
VSIREKLTENPRAVTAVTGGVVVLALVVIIWQMMGSGGGKGEAADLSASVFYTVDDGQSYFPDDGSKVPPFMKDGKPAYLAVVYTCDGGKTKFVAYLQRYNKEGVKKIEQSAAHGVAAATILGAGYTEVKPPGTGDLPKAWLKYGDPRALKLINVQCPNGGDPEAVAP